MSTRFSKLTLIATVGAVVALAVSACGGSESGSTAPVESPAPAAPATPAEPEQAPEPEPESVSDGMESGEGMDSEHMDTADGMDSEHEHDAMIEAPDGLAVSLEVAPDAAGGVNVRIVPTGFAFTPENVNGDHVADEGHAHIYVDGEKVARVYGEWYHLGGLEAGTHEIRATLNANTHAEYVSGEAAVDATASVEVDNKTESGGHEHGPDPVEASGDLAV
ncbi:MAG: hypothetical protein ACR2OD_10870, partial [Gaiellaceae bacterium]